MNDDLQQRRGDDFDRTPNDDVNDRLVLRGALPPRLPKDFLAVRLGDSVRVVITEADKVNQRSGSTDYAIAWAETVDTSTNTGLDYAAARAEFIGQVHAPGQEDRQSTMLVKDGRYQSGVFFCFGVDRDGNRSVEYLWSQPVTGEITDSSIPGDITHPSVSETSEGQGDMTVSVLSCSCFAPKPLTSFDRVQLWYKNYPTLGDLSEGDAFKFSGAASGQFQFQARNVLGRRLGTGSITVTNGSTAVTGTSSVFTQQVNNGGLIEILGVQGTISTVNSDGSITLSANWTGKSGTFTDFYFYPLITVYFVALSKAGTRRSDPTAAPSVTVLFDGNDSPPNAPSFTATSLGNAIRLDITPIVGTRIESYNVYRGTGTGVAFASCSRIGTVKHDPNNTASTIPFIDDNFTISQKETGQFFSYYVTTVMRSTTPLESAASARVEQSCRLNGGQDGDPSIPSRDGFKNVLFNGFIGGTGVNVGGTPNVVSGDAPDTSQDAFNNDPAIAPQTQAGIGTGVSRLRAWTRWNYSQGSGATVYATHINGNEVKLPAPGSGKYIEINQWILAWNTGTQKDKKIKLGGYYTLQVKAYIGGGTPNGTFYFGVAQYSGAGSKWAFQRKRLANDTIDETDANPKAIPGADLAAATATAPALLAWSFHLDGTYATDKVAISLRHSDSTAGDIYIKEAMLNEGYELAPYTPDMGNIDLSYPTGTNVPAPTPDPDGHHDGHYEA